MLFNIALSQENANQMLNESLATGRPIKECVTEIVRLFVGYCLEESIAVEVNIISSDTNAIKPATIDEQVLDQLEHLLIGSER